MVESQGPIDPQEAAQLIDGVRSARIEMARAVVAPAPELAHYSIAVAVLIGSGALSGWREHDGSAVVVALWLISLFASLVLLGSYIRRFRTRTGASVNSLTPKRARWVGWLLIPVIGALMFAAYAAGADGRGALAAVVALISIPIMLGMSRWWEREYVRGIVDAR